MTKEAYYFSHDSNARNDDKILELRAEFNWEGYGLFWGIIETLRDCPDYTYPTNRLVGLAYSLNYPLDNLIGFLKRCFELNLLVEKEGVFYSASLMDRMEKVDEKRRKRAEAGRAGGLTKSKVEQSCSVATENTSNATAKNGQNSSNSEAKGKQCLSNAQVKASKESKVKESKVKQNNIYPLSDTVTPVEDFDLFWNTYQKKVGKKQCLALWKKLPEKTKVKIMEVLPTYVSKTPDEQYRKNPLTWLGGEHWNDELISKKDFPLKMIM